MLLDILPKTLTQEIEELRKQLHIIYYVNGEIITDEVIQASKELDNKINEYLALGF